MRTEPNSARPCRPAPTGLGSALRAHRARIFLTYAMVNVEFLLLLAQPWACGRAVNGLTSGSGSECAIWVGLSALYVAACVFRRRFDTRTFAAVYATLVTDVIVRQRTAGVPTSRVVARVAFLRQVVEFMERTIPFLIQAAYFSVGAVVMLAASDLPTAGAAAAALLLTARLSCRHGRHTAAVNARLHDELERESDHVAGGEREAVAGYYAGVGAMRTALSDCEARNFGAVELLVLLLTAFAVARVCWASVTDPGRVSAALGYAALFGNGLLSLPAVSEQVGRLRDILRRIRQCPNDVPSAITLRGVSQGNLNGDSDHPPLVGR